MAEVVFINGFEVAPGREDAFLALWTEMDEYMRAFPGYRWRTLYKAFGNDAKLQYVNVAGWDSPEHFNAAHDDNFQRLQRQHGWREFPALPSLYQPVRQDVAQSEETVS